MAAREQAREEHLAAIRKIHPHVAAWLAHYSPEAIALAHDALQKTMKGGYDPKSFADSLRIGLSTKAFNHKNIRKILLALQQTAAARHNPSNLADILHAGLKSKVFSAKNLPLVISPLRKTLEQTANARRDPFPLAWTLREGLRDKVFDAKTLRQILPALQQTEAAGRSSSTLARLLQDGLKSNAFNSKNLPRVLELVSSHALKGHDYLALVTVLQTPQLPPTTKNLQALKEAEQHILHAYDFLHGVETIEDRRKVSAPLFAYILKTHKTLLPRLGEKDYWSHLKIYANELKANKTSIKPS